MSATMKIFATMKRFGKWAQKNQTLMAGFGATGVLIANERYGRRDIKNELAGLRTHVNNGFAAVDDKVTDLGAQDEFTQGLVLRTAVKMMKAMDGNKVEMREFVKDAEKLLHYSELGDDSNK
ncbi:hypothetical protein HOY80DRAFT_909983 [Tuber brumale]|nr:hypothetical protein HOY80DRAFT_909983 [Tuber brumale]